MCVPVRTDSRRNRLREEGEKRAWLTCLCAVSPYIYIRLVYAGVLCVRSLNQSTSHNHHHCCTVQQSVASIAFATRSSIHIDIAYISQSVAAGTGTSVPLSCCSSPPPPPPPSPPPPLITSTVTSSNGLFTSCQHIHTHQRDRERDVHTRAHTVT